MPRKRSFKSKEFISSDDSSSDLDEIVKAIEDSTMEANDNQSKAEQPAKHYNRIRKLSSSTLSDELDLSVPNAGPKVEPPRVELIKCTMKKYKHGR